MSEWQPIETAPKSGIEVQLWAIWKDNVVGQWWPCAYWDEGFCHWYINGDDSGPLVEGWDVTHWMPTPNPPKVQS